MEDARMRDLSPAHGDGPPPRRGAGQGNGAGTASGDGARGRPESVKGARTSEEKRLEGHNDGDGASPENGGERGRRRDKDRKRRDSRSRSGSRDHSRHKRRSSRSRERSRRSRSRSRDRQRSRRHRSPSRSRSRDRGRDRDSWKRSSRSRSREHYRTHRRHRSKSRASSGSEDRGGYRPRRRQEGSPGSRAKHVSQYHDPFYHLRQANAASNPEEALRKWQEQQLAARQMVLQQQAASAAAAASKSQRELYIGNLTPGLVTDEALRQVFNSALMAAFPESATPGCEPVVKANVHSDGRYAFVEFRKPEYATAALPLDGKVMLLGSAISVGRPASYVDPNKAQLAASQAAAALAAFRAGDTSALVTAGVQPAPGLPAPPATMAVPSPAALPPLPTGVPGPGGIQLPGAPNESAAPPPPRPPPGSPPPGLGKPVEATAYLCVSGMVTAETLSDEREYQETLEDLRDECSKVGRVIAVHVPRPADVSQVADLLGTGHYGKAFVSFETAESAAQAKAIIHGRSFAGSLVTVAFMTGASFEEAVGTV